MPVLNIQMNDLSNHMIDLLAKSSADKEETSYLVKRRNKSQKKYQKDLLHNQRFGGQLYSLNEKLTFAYKLDQLDKWKHGRVLLLPNPVNIRNNDDNPRGAVVEAIDIEEKWGHLMIFSRWIVMAFALFMWCTLVMRFPGEVLIIRFILGAIHVLLDQIKAAI